MKINIFLIFILIVLSSCHHCQNSIEPTLQVQFDDHSSYEKMYGIGGKDTLQMTYSLPVSINSDTSIYLFIDSSKIDTFGMTYKRTIRYHSADCGFSIELDSFKLLDISTFSRAQFNIHVSEPSATEDLINYYEVTLYR